MQRATPGSLRERPGCAWTRWFEPILELLAPRECAACGGDPQRGAPFCANCGEPRRVGPGALGGVPLLVLGAYEPPLSVAIGRYKFTGHPELAPQLAALLGAELRALALETSAVCVPVPLHPHRLVERGYNQASLLASALARAAGIGFAPRLLARKRATEQQARLGRSERAGNVHGAFRVAAALPAGRIVLVDDVVTTGATLLACIEVLRAAGAEIALAIALARAGG